MTQEERIAHAKKILDFQFAEYMYWKNGGDKYSKEAAMWAARWCASKDMYELLTGESAV